MNCKRCDNQLTGKQKSYCSLRCSKLHLKSLYKKRNKNKINEHRRLKRKEYYSDSPTYHKKIKPNHLKENNFCLKCGITENLEVHHIKPRRIGGKSKPGNLMTLCKKHHYEFEKLTKDFWNI